MRDFLFLLSATVVGFLVIHLAAGIAHHYAR